MSPHKSLSTPRIAPNLRTTTPNKRSNNNQTHNIYHTSASTSTSTMSSSSHPVLDTKDRRSYEYARQKHLHPSDRNPSRSKPYRYRVGNSKKDYLNFRLSGGRWVEPITSDDIAEAQPDPDYVGPYEWNGGWDVEESHATGHILPLEVSLTDLIRPTRKRKGIAKDYEFVPRVRTVMIINDGLSDSDSDSGPSGSGDDDDAFALDWEVVPDLAKRKELRAHPSKSPTYAAVTRTR